MEVSISQLFGIGGVYIAIIMSCYGGLYTYIQYKVLFWRQAIKGVAMEGLYRHYKGLV
jgi:hypothetical protein